MARPWERPPDKYGVYKKNAIDNEMVFLSYTVCREKIFQEIHKKPKANRPFNNGYP